MCRRGISPKRMAGGSLFNLHLFFYKGASGYKAFIHTKRSPEKNYESLNPDGKNSTGNHEEALLSSSKTKNLIQVKSVIVTGAYGAIGKAIARQMAEKGYSVVLVGKRVEKLQLAAEEISRNTGSQHVGSKQWTVADSGIRTMAERWSGPLHILINNAVTAPWHDRNKGGY